MDTPSLETCQSLHPDSDGFVEAIQCNICLGHFKRLQIVELECSHLFCQQCALKLLEQQTELCPTCRRPFDGWNNPQLGKALRGATPSLHCFNCQTNCELKNAFLCENCLQLTCKLCQPEYHASKSGDCSTKHFIVPYTRERAIELCCAHWQKIKCSIDTDYRKLQTERLKVLTPHITDKLVKPLVAEFELKLTQYIENGLREASESITCNFSELEKQCANNVQCFESLFGKQSLSVSTKRNVKVKSPTRKLSSTAGVSSNINLEDVNNESEVNKALPVQSHIGVSLNERLNVLVGNVLPLASGSFELCQDPDFSEKLFLETDKFLDKLPGYVTGMVSEVFDYLPTLETLLLGEYEYECPDSGDDVGEDNEDTDHLDNIDTGTGGGTQPTEAYSTTCDTEAVDMEGGANREDEPLVPMGIWDECNPLITDADVAPIYCFGSEPFEWSSFGFDLSDVLLIESRPFADQPNGVGTTATAPLLGYNSFTAPNDDDLFPASRSLVTTSQRNSSSTMVQDLVCMACSSTSNVVLRFDLSTERLRSCTRVPSPLTHLTRNNNMIFGRSTRCTIDVFDLDLTVLASVYLPAQIASPANFRGISADDHFLYIVSPMSVYRCKLMDLFQHDQCTVPQACLELILQNHEFYMQFFAAALYPQSSRAEKLFVGRGYDDNTDEVHRKKKPHILAVIPPPAEFTSGEFRVVKEITCDDLTEHDDVWNICVSEEDSLILMTGNCGLHAFTFEGEFKGAVVGADYIDGRGLSVKSPWLCKVEQDERRTAISKMKFKLCPTGDTKKKLGVEYEPETKRNKLGEPVE